MRGRTWWLLLLVLPGFLHAWGQRWIYQSPVPGASMVSPGTNIILRCDQRLLATSVKAQAMEVRGSVSGVVSGKFLLADDGETLLFIPHSPLAYGEEVSVLLRPLVLDMNGAPVPEISWSFRTSRKLPDDAPRITPMSLLGDDLSPSFRRRKQTVEPEATVSDLPQGFPLLSVTVDAKAPEGALFLSNFVFDTTIANTPFLMVLDSLARPLYYQKTTASCLDFKRQPDGTYTYFDGGLGGFVQLDSSFQNQIGFYFAGGGYDTDVHDLQLLPDGHALLLADDREEYNMAALVPGGDSTATVIGNIIQELDPEGNVVFQWRSWDNFSITDASLVDFTATLVDPVHMNSLTLDSDGNIILSSRHLDEITKIDRRTGAIIWRLGGRHNQFTLLGDTLWFSHQHAARILANGDLTLFDNGNGHTPQFSRAMEYALDTTAKTVRRVWQFVHSPTIFGSAMGYVQRLDDGNTLIGWGATNPSVSEVTPSGQVEYELSLPPGVYSYRAYLFPVGFAGGEAGVPPITAPLQFGLRQNFPNPFNPATTIRFSVAIASHVTLSIYNTLGERVTRLVDGNLRSGEYEVQWNAAGMPSGAYFCQMRAGAFAMTKRLLLIR